MESLIRAGKNFHSYVDAVEPTQSDGEYNIEFFKLGLHGTLQNKKKGETIDLANESEESLLESNMPGEE